MVLRPQAHERQHEQGAHLLIGHSHSYNAPVLLARQLIASGRFGAVRMIHALQYTDFLYRPRRPGELDTAQGGGVIFSQAAHQVDVVRLLAGGLVERVSAVSGRWDPLRPTEGAYSALLSFA
ncbi:MAG: gfo/Idh/MocA family oxidoreductase, partial [Oxalobacteraceae bacterium]|nr:gfo/Idh/MocA family oxidoreductase [Oxalobacteraceae bacterium]